MRKQRSGTVVNLGSIVGWEGASGSGAYSPTKFAIAGISESLKLELAPFNIEVVCIEPGAFRTGFLSVQNRQATQNEIADYAELTKQMKTALDNYNNNQPGDLVKGSAVIVEAVTKTGAFAGTERLPARLTLGNDAAIAVSDKLQRLQKEHEEFSPLTRNTDWQP